MEFSGKNDTSRVYCGSFLQCAVTTIQTMAATRDDSTFYDLQNSTYCITSVSHLIQRQEHLGVECRSSETKFTTSAHNVTRLERCKFGNVSCLRFLNLLLTISLIDAEHHSPLGE